MNQEKKKSKSYRLARKAPGSDDNAAAQANITIIKNAGLAGRDGPLRLSKSQMQLRRIVWMDQLAGRICLAIASLGAVAPYRRRVTGYPTDIVGQHVVLQQPGMLMTRYHIQNIICQVLA